MKSLYLVPLMVVALVAFCSAPAFGQSGMPHEIHFQGKLSDQTGNPITAMVSVTFNIYNSGSGGSPLFTETHTVMPDARGIYSVRIGSITSGGINLTFNEPYFLGIQVGSDAEMAPRYAMAAAPYAMRAAYASTIDGLSVTAAELNQFAGISANVTAANLNILTGGAGSDASSLHDHSQVGNADTVDTLHASAAPTANTLLSLDASSKFPVSVITQGSGSGLDADLLDGQEGSFYQNASNLTAGTIPAARLPASVPTLTGANAWSGANSWSSASSFTGAASFNQQITSTLATGTAPFSITSTTRVTNLNADMVDGQHASGFATSSHSHVGQTWTASTATPILTMTQSGTGTALTASSAGGHAVQGTAAGASRAGLYGVTSSASGYGVYGHTTVSGARGVYGRNTGTTATSYAVYGYGGIGGYFRSVSTASSNYRGIELGPSYYGIYTNNSTNHRYGCYLRGTTYGGYFRGGSYGLYSSGSSYGLYLYGGSYGVYMPSSASTGALFRGRSYSLQAYCGTSNSYGAYFYNYWNSTLSGTAYGTRTYTYRANAANTGSMYGAYVYTSGYSSTTYGIYNRSIGTKGTAITYGAYDYNSTTSTGTRYGEYAYGATYAGYFSGNLRCTGTMTKGGGSFIQPHPTDPTKEINYRFFEGPENGIFERGVGTLVNGRAVVEMPEHFRIVAANEKISVQLTPRSVDSAGLALIEVSRDRFVVRELAGGAGNYDFDYFVTALRKGYKPHQPIQANVHFRPDRHSTVQDFEDGYTRVEGEDAEVAKNLLISNGLLNADGTLNRAKVLELGWKLPPDREEVKPEPEYKEPENEDQ